jgi:hypothetical protein
MFLLEFKQSLQKNCKGEYIDVDSRNELCLKDLQYFDEASNTIQFVSILFWLYSSTEFVCHIVKLYFLIFSAFQELIRSTFWIAIAKTTRIFGGDH